jgi:ribosomal protein L11
MVARSSSTTRVPVVIAIQTEGGFTERIAPPVKTCVITAIRTKGGFTEEHEEAQGSAVVQSNGCVVTLRVSLVCHLATRRWRKSIGENEMHLMHSSP